MTELITSNEKQTAQAAKSIATQIAAGSFIALYGDLGAGKTAFTRGLADGLDIKEQITSPTFTLLKTYDSGVMPLYHFDMYRINSNEELDGIGFFDYAQSDGLCVVEWAERVKEDLPTDRFDIYIGYTENEDERTIKIIPRGVCEEAKL